MPAAEEDSGRVPAAIGSGSRPQTLLLRTAQSPDVGPSVSFEAHPKPALVNFASLIGLQSDSILQPPITDRSRLNQARWEGQQQRSRTSPVVHPEVRSPPFFALIPSSSRQVFGLSGRRKLRCPSKVRSVRGVKALPSPPTPHAPLAASYSTCANAVPVGLGLHSGYKTSP
jgi:hypothetical protein